VALFFASFFVLFMEWVTLFSMLFYVMHWSLCSGLRRPARVFHIRRDLMVGVRGMFNLTLTFDLFHSSNLGK
jgi:hypothetical protein